MTDYYFDICNHCSRVEKCDAYTCNMRDELDEVVFKRFIDYEDELIPQLVKEWKKENKIVKQE